MKTKLEIEIESKDSYKILYEDGDVESEYDDKKLLALPKIRKQYAEGLHKEIIEQIKLYFQEGGFEENFLDHLEEHYIAGWDSLKDYGIKIKVTQK